VDALLRRARRGDVDLVMPVSDAVILPLSAARARFAEHTRLALPDEEALAAVISKERTLELAAGLGIPAPRTETVRTMREALAAGPKLGWPLVIKPNASRQYSGEAIEHFTVSYASGPSDLAERMARLEGRCPVLLQEYHRGAGYGVELLLHEGRPLAAFQHQRLREVPLTGGASALRRSVPLDPVLLDHSARIMRELRWTGLAMVEFRVGERGPVLMEINGRAWGSLPLAVRSGMDFPARLVELLLEGPPPEETPCAQTYRTGVQGRNLRLDLVWTASVLLQRRRYACLPIPARSAGLLALLGLLDPRVKCDNLTLDDPWPVLAGLSETLALFRSKLGEDRESAASSASPPEAVPAGDPPASGEGLCGA
jgi:predicted ATP-grasp superfamily ATP-dependent carboligase